MSLEEHKKDLEEQLEKALAREEDQAKTDMDALLEETITDAPEEVKEEPKEKEKVEEPKVEDPKVEEPKVEEPKKTPAEYAKERRDRAALREENERLRAELEAARQQQARKAEIADPEPDASDELEHTKWELRQTKKVVEDVANWKREQEVTKYRDNVEVNAEREFMRYEDEVVQQYPDYADARNHFILTQANAIRLENPSITQEQLVKAVKMKALTLASRFVNEGYDNPAMAMYEQIKATGWKPQPRQAEQAETVEERKPDLNKIAQNRARNAGMVGGSGSGGGGELTKRSVLDMTNEEWSKLPTAQKEKIMRGM